MVSSGWLNYPGSDLLSRLNYCIDDMKLWSRNSSPQYKKIAAHIRAEIEASRDLDDDESSQGVMDLKEKLSSILLQENSYWSQRAKNFWLRDGDTNSKFFHASATARKKRNKICRLKDDNGAWVESQQGLCDIAYNYFSNIYQARQGDCAPIISCLHRCISDDDNGVLTTPFTEEEFRRAIFNMHPDKSPGPDGLNPGFYQRFWSILGKDVFDAACSWLTTGHFPSSLNDTNIVLAPKVDNPAFYERSPSNFSMQCPLQNYLQGSS